jgi:hypothetical protein
MVIVAIHDGDVEWFSRQLLSGRKPVMMRFALVD